MTYLAEPLLVGASADPISVSLTDGATELLKSLPGANAEGRPADNRALLTTIVVAQAAAGRLHDRTLVIDAGDILQVLDHAATARPER